MTKKIIFPGLIFAGFIALFVDSRLSVAAAFSSLKFDAIIQMQNTGQVRSRCYIKGNKARIETNVEGQNSIFFTDGQKAYLYIPSANSVMAIPMSQADMQMPVNKNYKDIVGIKHIGQENIKGKDCDVYEYTKNNDYFKLWVAKDIDFPIKTEGITKQGKFTTYIENVQKDVNLDDSLFTLPQGAQVIDTQDLMKSIGSYAK